MAVERKYERDIDMLLAEEFAVSPSFAIWFLSHTRFREIVAVVHDVYVSKSDGTGESDLVVVFEEDGGGRRFALLIEDKIAAPLQPGQMERYEQRGQLESARGDYGEFQVVLCSPETYRCAHPELASFEPFISYERISEFLHAHDASQRGTYRANFVATAAMKNSSTWTRIDDAATNAFWSAAYDMATKEFPALEMKPLQLTKDSTWISIRPQDMPTSPSRVYVSVKGDRGFMDLTFTGCDYSAFSARVAQLVAPDMTVHRTGKSTAIRITVDGFKASERLDAGLVKVRRAFAACERLIEFYRTHRNDLDKAVADALLPI